MTENNDIYRQLQQHLDRQAVGFPATQSGADIRFLTRMFTPEEAAVALLMSYQPEPVETICGRATQPVRPDAATRHLDHMFAKGAIGWKAKAGVGHWYLMPMVIGMYEMQAGQLTPEFMKDALGYMKTMDYGKSLISVTPTQMRTIPVNASIDVTHHAATYDQMRALVASSFGPFVVVPCICREGAALRKQPCTKTSRVETCLAFGSMAAMVLRRGRGREVTSDEVLAILQQNEADGLVLQPSNTQKAEFICSCCGCCCGMLQMQKRLPHPVNFWTSDFYAVVAEKDCVRCGVCVKRCQVNAITMTGPSGTAVVNRSRCIGCGLCVTTCPKQAISLVPKKSQPVPPENEEALFDAIKKRRNRFLAPLVLFLKMMFRMK